MTRTTRFFIDRKASAVDIKRGCRFLGRCLCKREPRRGDRIQAGVEAPVKHTQKEKAPKRRWNSSISVIVPSLLRSFDGGCFHTGVALPLTPACILSHLQRFILLYSVAPLGLTIHTTLSRTRVLIGAVHSSQGGRPAGFTICLHSTAPREL